VLADRETCAVKAKASAEWRAHWPVVMSGGFATTLLLVYMYSTGIMIAPLQSEFGWTRAQISSGPMLVALITVVLAPFVGVAIDRFGPRRIGLIGALLYCFSIASLSMTTSAISSWWFLWLTVGITSTAVTPAVWSAGVSGLFTASRGLALAITLTGTGLGTMLVPIVGTFFLGLYGWRGAYLCIALTWAVTVIPVIFLFFHGAQDKVRSGKIDPGDAPENPRAAVSRRDALTSPRFYMIAVASCGITLVVTAVNVNMVPLLTDNHTPIATAARIAGLAGIGSMLGRLVGGYLLDRYNANLVGGITVAIPVLSLVILLTVPDTLFLVGIAVFSLGIAIGVEYDAVAYITVDHFGIQNFGTLFSTIAGMLALVGGFGPLVMNYIYDQTGSYSPMLWSFIPICVMSSALFLTLGAPSDTPSPVD